MTAAEGVQALINLLSEVKVSTLITAAGGAAIGALATQFKEWRARKRRQKAHWYALSAEVELCREMAETFYGARYASPLYRLSTLAYLHSFPGLLADGAARMKQDTRAVTQFYNQVEALNRGLDQANDARDDDQKLKDNQKLKEEHLRNRMKAEDLIGSGKYYIGIRQVLDRHAP